MSKDRVIDYDNGMSYYERYYESGKLNWKGIVLGGELHGYHLDYNDDGSVNEVLTGYFSDNINVSTDNDIGYCYIWRKEEIV